MNEVIDMLTKMGAILTKDHFVGTSGLHFDTYMDKNVLYPFTKETSQICRLFADRYKDKNIDVVVGPALGGIILSQWVTHHLNLMGGNALAVYTEKTADGGQVFTRGYDKLVAGKRVLILEDNVSTGGSILKTMRAVSEAGGKILGVCAIVNRNPEVDSKTFGVPFEALGDFYVPLYTADECPLCKAGVPINTTLGHGKKFLEERRNKNDHR